MRSRRRFLRQFFPQLNFLRGSRRGFVCHFPPTLVFNGEYSRRWIPTIIFPYYILWGNSKDFGGKAHYQLWYIHRNSTIQFFFGVTQQTLEGHPKQVWKKHCNFYLRPSNVISENLLIIWWLYKYNIKCKVVFYFSIITC